MQTGASDRILHAFWHTWARYWSHFEDLFLDLNTISRLAKRLESPVLVIGGGQGLLVERLRSLGLTTDGVEREPAMAQRAKSLRGLDLICADGQDLPIRDGAYRSAVVATGVVDFLSDELSISAILHEAGRVVGRGGRVWAAFHRFHPQVEKLLRKMGLLGNGVYRYRRLIELSLLAYTKPRMLYKELVKREEVGRWVAIQALIGFLLLAPAKEKQAFKTVARIHEQEMRNSRDSGFLLRCMPEHLPYRGAVEIERLLGRLGAFAVALDTFPNCWVAEIGDSSAGGRQPRGAQAVNVPFSDAKQG